jgi:hypothetical protein
MLEYTRGSYRPASQAKSAPSQIPTTNCFGYAFDEADTAAAAAFVGTIRHEIGLPRSLFLEDSKRHDGHLYLWPFTTLIPFAESQAIQQLLLAVGAGLGLKLNDKRTLDPELVAPTVLRSFGTEEKLDPVAVRQMLEGAVARLAPAPQAPVDAKVAGWAPAVRQARQQGAQGLWQGCKRVRCGEGRDG